MNAVATYSQTRGKPEVPDVAPRYSEGTYHAHGRVMLGWTPEKKTRCEYVDTKGSDPYVSTTHFGFGDAETSMHALHQVEIGRAHV